MTEKPSAASPPSQFVEFAYDALDRRVSKSIDADADGTVDRVTYFVVDGLRSNNDGAGDHVLLTLTDPDGPSGPAAAAVDHRFLHGPAIDQILADELVESGSTPPTSRVLWTLTDHQHTVRDLAARDAATGVMTVVPHRQFDAFGEMTAAVNPSDPSASVVDTLFGYTGREFDPETGLTYARARYYDPALAQFVNEDPLGFAAGDANIRRYVGNHATYAVDPSGLEESTYRTIAQWITPFALPKALARFHASRLEDAEQSFRAGQHEGSAEFTSFLRQMAQKADGLYDSTNTLLIHETLIGIKDQFVGARDKAAVSRQALLESEYSQWSSSCIAACVFLGDLIGSVAIDEAWEGKTFIEEEELTPSQRVMKVIEATEKIVNVATMVLSLKSLIWGGAEGGRTSRSSTGASHAGERPTGQSPHPTSPRSPATTAASESWRSGETRLIDDAPSGASPRIEPPRAESPTHGPPKASASSVALEIEQRAIDLELPDQLRSKGGVGTSEVVAPKGELNVLNPRSTPNAQTLNKVTAYDFYTEQAGFSPSRTLGHMEGIDFSRPVTPVTIPYGTTAQQFVGPRGTGHYFAPCGSTPLQSGIPSLGTSPTLIQSCGDIPALQSFTRPDYIYPPGAVLPGSGAGNGLQYFVPNNGVMVPIGKSF